MPEMPLKTPRSAFSKVKVPSSGVRPGTTFFQGPNDPVVVICPGGTALVITVWNGIFVRAPTDWMCSSCMRQTFGRLPALRGRIVSVASSATSSSITISRSVESPSSA